MVVSPPARILRTASPISTAPMALPLAAGTTPSWMIHPLASPTMKPTSVPSRAASSVQSGLKSSSPLTQSTQRFRGQPGNPGRSRKAAS
jgi:hypothetical protein